MSSYRLDRTAFKAQTATEAADHATYYRHLTWQERLRIANYLIVLPTIIPKTNHRKWIKPFLA